MSVLYQNIPLDGATPPLRRLQSLDDLCVDVAEDNAVVSYLSIAVSGGAHNPAKAPFCALAEAPRNSGYSASVGRPRSLRLTVIM